MLAVPIAAAAETTTIHRTELVSVSGEGVAANHVSVESAISGDGRYIAFATNATNLVVGDTNGSRDVYLRDTQTGTTTLISKATNGTIGDSTSSMPSMTPDGRYIAFESFANNFGGGAVNKADVFVHDRDTGTTSLVSKASNGNAGLDGSHHPSISADGTRIAFYSYADNFSAVDENTVPNTFVHDTDTTATTLASRSTGGTAGDGESVNPAISANGEVVAFQSMADNLVSGSPDTDGIVDVFAHNLEDDTTVYVSKATDGTPGSGDSGGESYNPSISGDGRYVAFASRADTLAPDDALLLSDVFVHDLDTAATTHVSKASDGTPGTGPPFGSFNPSISTDGRYVAFDTTFTNLSDADADGLDVDSNEVADVFVHDRQSGDTRYVSRSTAGVAGDKSSYLPKISGDGSHVAFQSHAETLSGDDPADQLDVFLHKLIPVPPENVVPPELTGTGAVGATLTCDAGTWDDGTVTQVWRRNGVPIPGATGPTYTVTAADAGSAIDCLVTAANPDGNASLVTGSVVIPGVPPGSVAADSIAPRLTNASFTRKRFRVGGGKRRGTTLRVALSERATIRVSAERRKGKRWRAAGTISESAAAGGAQTLRITGRVGRRKLSPGRYRVAIIATDAAGNRSAPVMLAFRIRR
jgi:Tol biopolymer transport system component